MPSPVELFAAKLADINDGTYGLFPDAAMLSQEAYIKAGPRLATVALGERDARILTDYARSNRTCKPEHYGKLALLVTSIDMLTVEYDLEVAQLFTRGGEPPIWMVIATIDMLNDGMHSEAVEQVSETICEFVGYDMPWKINKMLDPGDTTG